LSELSNAGHESVPLDGARIVLLAEPDEDTRRMYEQAFLLDGWRVVEAVDGREAVAHAHVRTPSLVVTGLRLPFVDGYSLCATLRRDRATADVPILVVTGESRPAELQRAQEAGADAILTKPAPVETMIDAANALLRRSVAVRRRAAAARVNVAAQFDRSAALLARSRRLRRVAAAKAAARTATTTRAAAPPPLHCPSCDRALRYSRSHVSDTRGGAPQQWDYYTCPGFCGTFQYGHRTHRLRHIS
jgi:DNA-binding response OmpR family regulator